MLPVVRLLLLGSLICYLLLAIPQAVLAQENQPSLSVAARPLPPHYGPQMAPPITYGYHEAMIFPVTGKWIDVDLSEQRVIVYQGAQAVRDFIVSTGLPATPTVQGQFQIRMKVRVQTMSGGSAQYGYYNLPNVEWVQYFYEDYAFHGTYWHNNFGQPMSHGCVNMTNEDAQWLFEWSDPDWQEDGPVWQKTLDQGTSVLVHE